MHVDIIDERQRSRGSLSVDRYISVTQFYEKIRTLVPDLRFLLTPQHQIVYCHSDRTVTSVYGRVHKLTLHVIGGKRVVEAEEVEEEEEHSDEPPSPQSSPQVMLSERLLLPPDHVSRAAPLSFQNETSSVRPPDPIVRCRMIDDLAAVDLNHACSQSAPVVPAVVPSAPSILPQHQTLCDMGFSLERVVEALAVTNDNVEEAMAFLVE